MNKTVYVGSYVHSVDLKTLEHVERAALCVSKEGIIEWIETLPSGIEGLLEVGSKHSLDLSDGSVEVVELGKDEFLCPGLIDTHTHAPQYPNIGLGHGVPLLDWLDKLTFPTEFKYKDPKFARGIYEKVVASTLSAGTTTVCYYSSLHYTAAVVLTDVCLEKGQRAFVGKCSMDRNSPDYYVEGTEEAITDARRFVETFPYLAKGAPKPDLPPLVQPILTPRMAISTTTDLLDSLSILSKGYDPPLAIQTHLSENGAEINTTMSLFPHCTSYTQVYELHGMLGPGTILAHCCHLSDDERKMIAKAGAGISHCPTSNFHLDSGIARVREMLDAGINVGLGSDCSGGYAPGLLPNLRVASHVSRQIAFDAREAQKTYDPLTVAEAFHMATLGGATLCRLQESVGNFIPGKEFDALRIKAASPGMGWMGEGEGVEDRFQRWFWSGDDRDIFEVYVRGKKVSGTAQ